MREVNKNMRFIKIIFFSFMLSACASAVNIDYNKDINFTSFKTYNIEKNPVRVSVDTRIDSPFMQQRVVKELDAILTKKGFKFSKDNAELRVKYYLDIKRDFETESSGVSIGFGSFGYHSAVSFGLTIPVGETYSVDKLVLTIDMLSTKTGELVWRGSLANLLYEGATPESYNELVNELVTDLLKDFPPK